MTRTILAAGLLAALAGTAVLAQAVATPDDGAPTAPEATAPAAPDAPATADGPAGLGRLGVLLAADADGDGVVTREEIEARQARRFADADADGNGGLDAAELLALEDAQREEARAAQAASRVAQIDDNGDGLLQAEEIEARTPRIAPLFDRLDADGDGGLSAAELAAAGPRGDGPGPDGFEGVLGGPGDGPGDRPGRGGRGHDHGGPRGELGGGFLFGLLDGQG